MRSIDRTVGKDGVVETVFWHQLEDGRVQCDVCPRLCKLKDGQRGFCFVRANQGNKIVLTSYGRSSGFCIDPIEKKPLNHFLPGTPVLSFGTAGCNLGCRFCQNWDISKSREIDTLASEASPEKIARVAHRFECRSVAYTYNDPTVFLEYAIDTAKACRDLGIKNVAVSAGYICPEARRAFYREMDAANIDLKAFSENFYHKICFAELESVKETLIYLKNETDVWLEVTTLLIPGENDSDDELYRMSDWMMEQLGPDVPWHFSAFHPDFKMMHHPRTPAATLVRARKIAQKKGMRYVYLGNIDHPEGASTYCPGCGKRLIGRDWYEVTDWALTRDGRCRTCWTKIPGVFESCPGSWGAKRVPINMNRVN